MAQESDCRIALLTNFDTHERSIKIYAMAVAILLTYEHKKCPLYNERTFALVPRKFVSTAKVRIIFHSTKFMAKI